ncbi:hypothetical protein BDY24DRAFT_389867 [Mrakia frigida]|uniref:uncharacterized protein n=1 Tax=Mrakia frigida TaxID=29902 RepID=UPI003FCBF748
MEGAATLPSRGKKGGGTGTAGSSPVLPAVSSSSKMDWSQITRVGSGGDRGALQRSRSKEEEGKSVQGVERVGDRECRPFCSVEPQFLLLLTFVLVDVLDILRASQVKKQPADLEKAPIPRTLPSFDKLLRLFPPPRIASRRGSSRLTNPLKQLPIPRLSSSQHPFRLPRSQSQLLVEETRASPPPTLCVSPPPPQLRTILFRSPKSSTHSTNQSTAPSSPLFAPSTSSLNPPPLPLPMATTKSPFAPLRTRFASQLAKTLLLELISTLTLFGETWTAISQLPSNDPNAVALRREQSFYQSEIQEVVQEITEVRGLEGWARGAGGEECDGCLMEGKSASRRFWVLLFWLFSPRLCLFCFSSGYTHFTSTYFTNASPIFFSESCLLLC